MYLGIDLGTQSVKTLLLDSTGQVVGRGQAAYPIYRPFPGWAEQHPQDWWTATVTATRAACHDHADQVECIGITGQMHGTVLLDSQGKLLRPAIIWMDQRSAAHALAVQQRYPNWLDLAFNTLSPGMMGASLLWLQAHEPEIMAQATTILFPKDWIRYHLAKTQTTDLSDASGGILLNIPQQAWSRELLNAYGVTPAQFPHLMKSVAIIGNLTPEAATELGLKAGIRVGVGAGDQPAMLVGSGAIEPGQAVLTIGTGGQLSIVTNDPHPDSRLNTFCHAVPNHWYNMGAILAAGYALAWWQKVVGEDLETMLERAAQVPAGSEGLIFRPYLNGERTPHMNPDLTAQFLGLTARHEQGHLTRAVLEGVAFAIRDCLETLHQGGTAPQQLIFGGGGAKGKRWRQIIASVLGIPLVTLADEETTAKGAAMLACVGCQHVENIRQAVEAWVRYDEVIEPEVNWGEVYAEGYERFRLTN
jgi:xylulokinase